MIYLDHAATTPMRQEVLDAMLPFFKENFGNPSSLYPIGDFSRKAIDKSRVELSNVIGSGKNEIIFTGSGTESDNLAIRGSAKAMKSLGNHIIFSAIEHHAVIHCVEQLQEEGFTFNVLDVDQYGSVNLDHLSNLITDQTTLVSIMSVNNEVGTIQNIREISEIIKDSSIRFGKKILFHTDAIQALGKIESPIITTNVDLMSLSAHKVYGPKGVGALFIKKGTQIEPLLNGGGQEHGIRSGTENVPGIVGFGLAAELAENDRLKFKKDSKNLNKIITEKLSNEIEGIKFNGHRDSSVDSIINFSIPKVDAESLLILLSNKGVNCSSGSACESSTLTPSHVLLAMGISYEEANSSVRLSFGITTSTDEILEACDIIIRSVKKLKINMRN